MKSLLVALILAATASSTFASGEVGASDSNSATNTVAVVADTGVSSSWTSKAFEGQATAHKVAKLNKRIEALSQPMNLELEKTLNRKTAIQTQVVFIY